MLSAYAKKIWVSVLIVLLFSLLCKIVFIMIVKELHDKLSPCQKPYVNDLDKLLSIFVEDIVLFSNALQKCMRFDDILYADMVSKNIFPIQESNAAL